MTLLKYLLYEYDEGHHENENIKIGKLIAVNMML